MKLIAEPLRRQSVARGRLVDFSSDELTWAPSRGVVKGEQTSGT
jgi:hypothetical protein